MPLFHHPRQPSTALPFARDESFTTFVADTYVQAQGSAKALGAPSANPYALRPDALSFLHELLSAIRPRRVVEFGSGESTRVFAEWCESGRGSVISIENDLRWIKVLEDSLAPEARRSVTFVHAPLALSIRGLRVFLTFRGVGSFMPYIRDAAFIFLDGPQASGREAVLYEVLNHASVGATIVLDDFNLYFLRDMLAHVPRDLAAGFVGSAIEGNSHGLYVLRCVAERAHADIPAIGAVEILQSCWRSLRDFVTY